MSASNKRKPVKPATLKYFLCSPEPRPDAPVGVYATCPWDALQEAAKKSLYRAFEFSKVEETALPKREDSHAAA